MDTQETIRQLMIKRQKNYSKSIPDLRDTCSKCHGEKYVYVIQNGYEVAVECECFKKEKLLKSLERSGIKTAFENKTFKDMNFYNQELKQAKSTIGHFLEDFKEHNLLITGKTGTGKSHLAICALKDLVYKAKQIKYTGYRELINKIKPLSMSEERDRVIYEYLKPEVLMIDDLFIGYDKNSYGISGITEADLKIVYEIVNHRYNNKLTTIYTTELSLVDLIKISETIAGRIVEQCEDYIISLNETKNYRLRNIYEPARKN